MEKCIQYIVWKQEKCKLIENYVNLKQNEIVIDFMRL